MNKFCELQDTVCENISCFLYKRAHLFILTAILCCMGIMTGILDCMDVMTVYWAVWVFCLVFGGYMEKTTLYLKLEKNVEVSAQDIFLKDLGTLFCENGSVVKACKDLKICELAPVKNARKVISVMRIIELIGQNFPEIRVENIGETDVLVESIKAEQMPKWKEVLKICFVSAISFFGTAFTIMAFHNDIGITDLFDGVHEMITGTKSSGHSVLEISYSLGLSVGIIIFFNHIGGKRITKDPTPIEVEMRIYEDEVNQTLIDAADRMQMEIDVER